MSEELVKKQQKSLSSLTSKLHQLPMLPTVVSRMMMLDADSDSFQKDALELISEDPTFAARVIQLANSAHSHPLIPILTLQDAIVRMGSESISNLVTSLGVIKVFIPTCQTQRDLWIHSIQTAVSARAIAVLSKVKVIAPEQAYLCGLMHDIGRFLMFSESPDELGRVEERGWHSPKELIKVEREICGYDHAELGWHACRSWKMPALVTNVVRYHHNYHFNKSRSSKINKHAKIIRLIQMADYLSVLMMKTTDFCGLENAVMRIRINEHCVIDSWPEIPVPVSDLARVSKSIFEDSERLISNLGLKV